jgi:hypothetical protein
MPKKLSPVTRTRRELEQVASRLGLTVISARHGGDLQELGKILEENGAVHAGRGLYLLAADHLMNTLNAAAAACKKLDEANLGGTSEEAMAWLRFRKELAVSIAELGQNIIKSETILRDLPKPLQTTPSFAPGSIVGPVQIVMHKQPEQPPVQDAVEVNGR